MNKITTIIGSESSHIHIAPNRRGLPPNFDWQKYITKAIKFISVDDFSLLWNNNKSTMEATFNKWQDNVLKFLFKRTAKLGLEIDRVFVQLIEEPNDDKAIEVMVWENRKAVFVWAIWAYIRGPLPSAVIQPSPLPLVGFWPQDKMNGTTAEIFNAEDLIKLENGEKVLDIPKDLL